MDYTVRLEAFEGPFDLLFHLIEKAKVDIYNIPIAQITGQYLEYIDDLTNFDLEIASEFLLMASTLIEIKSKMLLPSKKEEQLSMDIEEDPRQDLVQRLIEYKKYKNIAQEFKNREEKNKNIYFKQQEQLEIYLEESIDELVDLEPNLLFEAFQKLLSKKQTREEKKSIFDKIERDEISIESKINQIKNCFLNTDYLSFNELFMDTYRKSEIIVTFMALLELIKSKYLQVNQNHIFGEIIISKRDNSLEVQNNG